MIPRIAQSRSQLHAHLNEYADGAMSFVVSPDTFAELFTLRFPEIVQKAPKGWARKKNLYLWFPPHALDELEIEELQNWKNRLAAYVLIGMNTHLENHFTDELDFCMALDFNRVPEAAKRTIFGEAVYQLKYKDSDQHIRVLGSALLDAVSDLPIPSEFLSTLCFSCIPASPQKRTIPRRLAEGIAKRLSATFVDAELNCPKAPLKNATVDAKIPLWQSLYDQGCVELSDSVEGRLVVVVDDLYQSGATMWAYAGFLKSQGAAHVIGLPCVKSLRDSDNQ